MVLRKFNKKFLESMGVDSQKSELIEFLIENESLNIFDETEHFYYWIHRSERVLRDNFGFLQNENKPFIYKINEKEFDLNTFDGITELVIEVKDKDQILKIFNDNLNLGKTEYILRYSKKYNSLEYYGYKSCLQPVKKRKMCFVRHKKFNFFKINDKNFVLFYFGRQPRYVSNKSALFLRPIHNFNCNSNKDYQNYLYSINRRLVSIHQKTKIYNDSNFVKTALDLQNVENKLMFNTKNIDELLNKVVKNKPVPKILIDKFKKSELVYLYTMINYEEVDKIIKYLYDNPKLYMEESGTLKNCMRDVILDYLYSRFLPINSDSLDRKDLYQNMERSTIIDYMRMCETQKIKLNLKIKSFKRLEQEHDNLSFNISAKNIPDIKVNKKYPKIKSEGNFEIEQIVDKKRLLVESEIQKHCVKTYASSINAGRCCIYSFLDLRTKNRYTLEVQKKYDITKNLLFILNQIRGKFNSNPSGEILFEIYGILIRNKIYPSFELAKKDHLVVLDDLKTNNNWFDDEQLPF